MQSVCGLRLSKVFTWYQIAIEVFSIMVVLPILLLLIVATIVDVKAEVAGLTLISQ